MSKRRGEYRFSFNIPSDFSLCKHIYSYFVNLCQKATEVNVARGRLKGALQDIVNINEEEDEVDASKPSRGRPPKRAKKEPSPVPQPTVQHSFIMKLFDRCVDLAKYNENTALYPYDHIFLTYFPLFHNHNMH